VAFKVTLEPKHIVSETGFTVILGTDFDCAFIKTNPVSEQPEASFTTSLYFLVVSLYARTFNKFGLYNALETLLEVESVHWINVYGVKALVTLAEMLTLSVTVQAVNGTVGILTVILDTLIGKLSVESHPVVVSLTVNT
jgi:hypothetical protein